MRQPTVLVVDDHAPTREAYAAYLEEYGYRVLQAAHGGEAILHVHNRRPDVVLLDLVMPVIDGLETAQSLRSCVPTAETPILAITGSVSSVALGQILPFCDGLLLKPCAPDEIVSRIRSLIGAVGMTPPPNAATPGSDATQQPVEGAQL